MENGIDFEDTTISAVRASLLDCGLNVEVSDLFKFMRRAIEGREYGKFIFTKAVSDILVILCDLGAVYNINRGDMSFVSVNVLHGLYTKLDTTDLGALLRREVEKGKAEYSASSSIQLPILITCPEDVYSAKLPEDLPNFITNQTIQGG